YSARARSKGLRLYVTLDPNVAERVVGDGERIRQILKNLVSNAIKFTREGTIVARAMLEEEHEDSVQLRISIQDTGIGLSNQDVRALFQAFSQADNSLSRQPGGTGLGLVI
ncbi:ATP-binding protein, partial [Pseudomonas sp. SIMBA_077]